MLHSVDLTDEMVILLAIWVNPATGNQEIGQFFTDFNTLYQLLSGDDVWNSDYAIEAIADMLNSCSEEKIVAFDPEKPVVFMGLVFRLSPMEAMNEDNVFHHAGYLIEDAIEGVDGVMSLEEYVEGCSKEQMVRRAMSAHIVSLALRYAYYRLSLKKGKKKAEALKLTELEDKEDFRLAKSAHGFVCVKGRWELT